MKKRILTAIAFVALSFSAVSCGGQAATEPAAATPAVSKEVQAALINSLKEVSENYKNLAEVTDYISDNAKVGDYNIAYYNHTAHFKLSLQKAIVNALEVVAVTDKSYEPALKQERAKLADMEANFHVD